jgi:hypothetical protein
MSKYRCSAGAKGSKGTNNCKCAVVAGRGFGSRSGFLHCGGKCAAFGRNDEDRGGVKKTDSGLCGEVVE